MVKNYSLQFNSSVSVVTLPHVIENVSKLKIQQIRYVTQSGDNKFMLIKFAGWTDSNYFFNGVTLQDYTKFIPLIHKTDSLIMSEYTSSNTWDVEKTTAVSSLNSFRCEILIDGEYSSDITPSNPLFIEIALE